MGVTMVCEHCGGEIEEEPSEEIVTVDSFWGLNDTEHRAGDIVVMLRRNIDEHEDELLELILSQEQILDMLGETRGYGV